jgi:hypothetical protein
MRIGDFSSVIMLAVLGQRRVVPVARVTGEDAGSVFNELGRASLGWLLTASGGRLAPQQVVGGLWRAGRAVFAGDTQRDQPAVMLPWGGQQALAKALGATGEQAPGRASVTDERDDGLLVYGAVTDYGSGVLPHLTTVIVPALSGDALPGA